MAATARARSTRLGRGVLAGGVLLLVLGLLKDGIWLQLMGALLVGSRIAAVLLDPSRRATVRVQLHQPTRVTVGDAVETIVAVTNPHPRRLPSVVVRLTTAQLSDVTISTGLLPPGETTTLTVSRTALQRGLIGEHGVEVVTTDWFGFSSRVRQLALTGTPAFVRPPVAAQTWASATPHVGAVPGPRADRSGVEILAVREWQHGDQLRHVHWRSTARRGQVMVTTRSEPMDDHGCFVVASVTGQRLSDALAGRVAGAAVVDVRGGRPTSLFAAQPGLSALHYATSDDILDWCAQLDAPGLPDAAYWGEVAARMPAGSRVLLIADALPSPALRARVADDAAGQGLGLAWVT